MRESEKRVSYLKFNKKAEASNIDRANISLESAKEIVGVSTLKLVRRYKKIERLKYSAK